MINFIKTYIVSLIVIGIIDIPVISQIMSPMWKKMIEDIQVSSFKINSSAAFVAYLLLALGLSVYSIPNIKDKSLLKDSIIYGGLLGIIIYGVFDFTNLAIIRKYNLKIALIDMFWGGILFTISAYISKKILIKMKDII
jgi:uncharacterized membrane protein